MASTTSRLTALSSASSTRAPRWRSRSCCSALAANGGLPRALRFIAAVPVGWGLLFTLCAAGVGSLVVAVPALRWAILLGGTVYLLWLARRLWGSRSLSHVDASRMNVTFWQGVGLQFLNIKAWMLALTLSAGWVVNAAGQPSTNPGERLAIICGVMMVFAFTSNFAYALIGSLLRQWLAQGQRLLWFNRALALVLVATALWMLAL